MPVKSIVSIVIPVYNEAEKLAGCLLAISRQTVRPLEVIVVDNNSTDETLAIASRFDFVTLVSEPRQGVVHARNLGFDLASGEIIGRIDADTLIPSDWVETVQKIFSASDVDGISGAVSYYDFPWEKFTASVDLWFRRRIARAMKDEVFLYGANMAMRREAWAKVRASVCASGNLHEDFDLALHCHEQGLKLAFDERLFASVSLRRLDSEFSDFWDWVRLNPQTYSSHGRTSQRAMYPVIGLVLAAYFPIKLLHRGYDPSAGGFSLAKLAKPVFGRVNPATFVD